MDRTQGEMTNEKGTIDTIIKHCQPYLEMIITLGYSRIWYSPNESTSDMENVECSEKVSTNSENHNILTFRTPSVYKLIEEDQLIPKDLRFSTKLGDGGGIRACSLFIKLMYTIRPLV